MPAMILALSEATLERLQELADAYGMDLSATIERLLDRDPHDHDHRCPTCVRVMERAMAATDHLGQEALWA